MAGFAENGGMFPYMVDSARRTLFVSEPVGCIEPNVAGWTAEFLDWAEPELQTCKRQLTPSTRWRFLQGRGVRRGPLVGGCLEVLCWLRGTDVWPCPELWRGAVLFLEISEEAPPPITVVRELRVYAAMGILRDLAGILFGRPGGSVPPKSFDAYDRAIRQVIDEEEGLRDLPVITRMDFGHTDPMFVLPFGVQAEIDCDAQVFSILEHGVED
jgi:muramoyltetrapeptide carboxypeptidase LdcA involved in peptidoglycan recycling